MMVGLICGNVVSLCYVRYLIVCLALGSGRFEYEEFKTMLGSGTNRGKLFQTNDAAKDISQTTDYVDIDSESEQEQDSIMYLDIPYSLFDLSMYRYSIIPFGDIIH